MTAKRKKVLKPQSTEDLVDAFFSFMMYQMQLIYGDAHTDWWNKEGKALFYEWGKKQGIKFTEIDFTLPHFPKPDPRFVEVGKIKWPEKEPALPISVGYRYGKTLQFGKRQWNAAIDACKAAVEKAKGRG